MASQGVAGGPLLGGFRAVGRSWLLGGGVGGCAGPAYQEVGCFDVPVADEHGNGFAGSVADGQGRGCLMVVFV